MRVNLIYRKPNPKYFSIEKVFETVIPELPAHVKIDRVFVKEGRASLPALLKNLFQRIPTSEIYHVTGDIHYMALAFPSRKTILTIHDCVFMNQSKGLKRKIMQWLWLKLPVIRASLVTVISEATRQDVIKFTGANEHKIVVIENPVSKQFHYKPKAFNKDCPVLLQVGTWENKNLVRVAEAISGINCHLRVIGQMTTEQVTVLNNLGITYSNAWGLSEQEIVREYEASDVVVFASTYEGFGLPVIEANMVGRVVVTSNISPMKEITADAGVLIDPYNVDALRQGILSIISDDQLRDRLIQKGRENVKRYTASAIARKYVAAYQTIIEKQH